MPGIFFGGPASAPLRTRDSASPDYPGFVLGEKMFLLIYTNNFPDNT